MLELYTRLEIKTRNFAAKLRELRVRIIRICTQEYIVSCHKIYIHLLGEIITISPATPAKKKTQRTNPGTHN